MEMAQDLAVLIVACGTLIRQNALLSERIVQAGRAVDDAQVRILAKDIEIHDLKGRIS